MNGAAAIVSSREHLRDAACREELRENALPVLEALAASLGMVFRLTFVTGDRQGAQGEGRSGVSCAAFHQTLRERAIAGELNIRCVCPGGLLCLVKEIVVPDGRVIAVLEGAGYASGEAAMRNCELLDGMAGEWRQAPDQLEIVTPTRMRNAERLIAFTASSIGTRAASGDAGFSLRSDDPLSRAREFLRKNFREKLHREQVAAHVGVHADHLTRLFRESGAGFTDYLNAIRVRHAEQILLDTPARISEIAFACGRAVVVGCLHVARKRAAAFIPPTSDDQGFPISARLPPLHASISFDLRAADLEAYQWKPLRSAGAAG